MFQCYDNEAIAQICARFITHLFDCPETPSLTIFIQAMLYRSQPHQSAIFSALVLLQRLKNRLPTARGFPGEGLFATALLISCKILYDERITNREWSSVSGGAFGFWELNQMERDMCRLLVWDVIVDEQTLLSFRFAVSWDFSTLYGPYPTYSASMVSKYCDEPSAWASTGDSDVMMT